jgi:hypothetical protein
LLGAGEDAAHAGNLHGMRTERKVFFSEEKNQKTVSVAVADPAGGTTI